jgi:hypothetical protein
MTPKLKATAEQLTELLSALVDSGVGDSKDFAGVVERALLGDADAIEICTQAIMMVLETEPPDTDTVLVVAEMLGLRQSSVDSPTTVLIEAGDFLVTARMTGKDLIWVATTDHSLFGLGIVRSGLWTSARAIATQFATLCQGREPN